MPYVSDPTTAALLAAMGSGAGGGGVAPRIVTSGTSSGVPLAPPAPTASTSPLTSTPSGAPIGTRPQNPYGNLDAILAEMRQQQFAQQLDSAKATDPLLVRASLIGQSGPGGNIAGVPQTPQGSPDFATAVAQRTRQIELQAIQSLLRSQGLQLQQSNQTPFPFQPFGTASVGTEAGTGPGARGGDTSGIGGLNASGIGLAASDAVNAGFGALGPAANATSEGFNASPVSSVTGIGNPAEQGFNASPSHTAATVGLGPDVGIAGIALGAPLGDVSVADVSIGFTSDGQNVSVNPSTGVVSIGGEAIGVATGGGGGGGSGGVGGFGDGGGFGGGMDGSSNAGIGGPAGTGVAGGIGAAAGEGAGTGGVGEGEQFGNQFTVRGRGGVDSQPVRFMATPGELVTITPPGDPKNRALGDVLRIMSMRRGG